MSLSNIVRSSIGLKFVMAVTGILLYGFLIGHLLGNLLIYWGADAINGYAAGLKSLPYDAIWLARGGLLFIFVAHLAAALTLSKQNKSARPVSYAKSATLQASTASKTMLYSGLSILAFVLYHLAHFTFRIVQPTEVGSDAEGRFDVYQMVVDGFSQPIVSGIYIIAMVILGFHLNHGLASVFQTLGFGKKGKYCSYQKFSFIASWAVVLGNISIPVSVLLGLVSR